MDQDKIRELKAKAESLQKTWFHLAELLRTRPEKKVVVLPRRCTENARKCSRTIKELNAWQEQSESYLAQIEKDLAKLAESADRLLVTFGLSGHEPRHQPDKEPTKK